MCVCSGTCPSFTNGWSTSSSSDNGVAVCVSSKDGENVMNRDGDSVTATVNGETYTSPFEACPGGGGSGAGMIGMGYAGVFMATTALVGML